MKIEIINEGNNKKIKFIGKINMIQEVIIPVEDAKKLSEALSSGENTSFETQ